MEVKPIGVIHSPFRRSEDAPIQAAEADGAEGFVEVNAEFVPALRDLDGFERVWLLYWFDRAASFQPLVVPYRDDRERGLFATRAPTRPNPIGISAVRLLGIEGTVLKVADIDVLDGTPLLDIKPYAPRFDCFPCAHAGWLDDSTVGRRRADGRFSAERETGP